MDQEDKYTKIMESLIKPTHSNCFYNVSNYDYAGSELLHMKTQKEREIDKTMKREN